MRRLVIGILLCAAGCDRGGTAVDPANFVLDVTNALFPLTPGTVYRYEGETEDGFVEVVVEVTDQRRTVLGVSCVVVRATEYVDGERVEDTLDWYAQDRDGNVWYFGEDSKEYEGGVVVSTDGSWEAGVDGALPGIVMLAAPAVGAEYAQESAPGVAEDRARVVALDAEVTVALGTYSGCLETEDFTPLEPGVTESKFYAPGVGLVLEVEQDGSRVELVAVESD